MAALFAVACVVCGCDGPTLTRETFETLYVGQPADAVRRKLGEPTRRAEGVWVYVSEEPYYRRAEIHFDNGRVRKLEWSYDRPETPPGG
ncbi:MAG: hypothetical protein KGY99_10335 [Phycisphaerae bacterium]|nr:hypothetical protein [Phycisphaerae bacterium]